MIWAALLPQDSWTLAPDRLSAVRQRMQRFVDEREVAGVVYQVWSGDRLAANEAVGRATLNPDRPMKRDTIFQVMSMTKPVTAIAVMICVERGLLRLDDSVSEYIPAFGKMTVGPEMRPLRKPITIWNLLTHTSGLTGIDPGGLTDEAKVKLTLAEYAERFGPDPLGSFPGERIAYSGPGLAAAGRIVEIVTHRSLDEFMQQEIFRPLGMKDTGFFLPTSSRDRLARMYSAEHGQLVPMEGDPYRTGAKLANPAGGLYSTADDMGRLIRMVARGGALGGKRILSEAGARQLRTLQTGDLPMDSATIQGFGLGFSVVRGPSSLANFKPVGSFGHTGSFGTEYWASVDRDITVVFMTQSFNERVRKTFNVMLNAALTSGASSPQTR